MWYALKLSQLTTQNVQIGQVFAGCMISTLAIDGTSDQVIVMPEEDFDRTINISRSHIDNSIIRCLGSEYRLSESARFIFTDSVYQRIGQPVPLIDPIPVAPRMREAPRPNTAAEAQEATENIEEYTLESAELKQALSRIILSNSNTAFAITYNGKRLLFTSSLSRLEGECVFFFGSGDTEAYNFRMPRGLGMSTVIGCQPERSNISLREAEHITDDQGRHLCFKKNNCLFIGLYKASYVSDAFLVWFIQNRIPRLFEALSNTNLAERDDARIITAASALFSNNTSRIIREKESNRASLEATISQYNTRIAEARNAIERITAELSSMPNPEDAMRDNIEILRNHCMIEDLYVLSGKLYIKTKEITLKTRLFEYLFGKYEIIIGGPRENNLLCCPVFVSNISPATRYHHPHSGGGGDFCWSSTASLIREAYNTGSLAVLVGTIIEFLTHITPTDDYALHLGYFPRRAINTTGNFERTASQWSDIHDELSAYQNIQRRI